ncbi:MAG: hypothetical protein RLZZ01_495 [Actinomycetota bacterium]
MVAAGVPRRVLSFGGRVLLFVAGSIAIAVAVGVMFWNDIGPGPFDVFVGAVHERTGLPLAVALWVVVGVLVAIAWALGRRPGPGTLIGPLLVGPVLQFVVTVLESVDRPDELFVALLVQAMAIVLIGLGAGSLIVSGLGAGTGELLAAAASDRTGRPEARVRGAFEIAWLLLGIVLGGPIGVGTVIVAVAIGPAVATGYRLVDTAVSRTRPTTINPAPAALTLPCPSPSTREPTSAAISTLDSRSAAT